MSNDKQDESFYKRITRLFRSGPSIRRKIKGYDYKGFYDKSVIQNNLGYYGGASFKRESSPFSVMGAYGILDKTNPGTVYETSVGCWDLKDCLHDLKLLKLHVFGHIHCGYGQENRNGVNFVNAASCDEIYNPINEPIIIEL